MSSGRDERHHLLNKCLEKDERVNMEDKFNKFEKDINVASWIAIVFGVVGLVGTVVLPLLSPELLKILARPDLTISVVDIVWNAVTNLLSIWFGFTIRKKEDKRVSALTNLLGLYLLKLSLVIGTFFIGSPQNIRFGYLVPAIFFIFLGWRAAKRIAKSKDGDVRLKYKFKLGAWLIASFLIIFLYFSAGQINEIESGALMQALDQRDMQGVVESVRNGEDPDQMIMGRPLIFLGVKEGDDFYVKALVKAGADINKKSEIGGRTVLHEAALHGQVEIVKFLLEQGVDVNAKNNRGETPLFYAEGGLIAGPKMTDRNKRVAEVLREYGAIENSEISIEKILQLMVSKINQNTPVQIDKDTRFDSAMAFDDILTYKYSMVNFSLSKIAQEELKQFKEQFKLDMAPRLRNTVCEGDSMRELRERDVEFRYLYYDQDGREIGLIDIDSETCGIN